MCVLAKRVAIIGTRGYPSYYGGFETAVRKISPFLADAGWDVVVYGRDGATKQDDPTRDRRITTVTTRGVESRSLSTLSYGLSASLHAVVHKPNVALVMNVANGFFLPLLKARGIKTAVNVDGIEWDRAKWGRLAKAMFRLGANFTARFADVLIFDSIEIERRWRTEFHRGGVFIPYGGDVPPDEPVEAGLTHRGYVLVVARFVPENSIPEFLEAAEEIALDYPVVIVGSTGYGGELDSRASELAKKFESVQWLGHVSDDKRLLALWQHAGAYFHGHSVGGTNPTLVQALATATPIVARDTVYNREVLSDAGHFTAPDPHSIARTIVALMDDPEEQRRLSALALARSRASYTWEEVCARYERTISLLAENLSPSRRDRKRDGKDTA